MSKFRLFFALVLIYLCIPQIPSLGQKKETKKEIPAIMMAVPLAIQGGKTTKITLRGKYLDQSRGVRFSDRKIQGKILSKGKAEVPDNNADEVGDTQVIVEIALPKDYGKDLLCLAVNPQGESKPNRLILVQGFDVISEKEDNGGFQNFQPIKLGQMIDGMVNRKQDVDVFAIEGKANQNLLVEVVANRNGSMLVPMITLYDEMGRQVAHGEKIAGSQDVRMAVTLPRTGKYFISLLDAHDRGGPASPYLLKVGKGQEK